MKTEHSKTLFNRREFIGITTGSVALTLAAFDGVPTVSTKLKIRAIAFDAFVIFDPRPVFAMTEVMFPGSGQRLSQLWRTKQFEYTWLRTVSGHYTSFWNVTEDALVFAARALNLGLDSEKRMRLMEAYLELKAWPDVLPTLASLRAAGIRLAILSNFSRRMLEACVKNSGVGGIFDHLLSTDDVKQFKPASRAYQMAVDAFGIEREAIAFAAFAGWDAAGAKWFGFPTVWVNRLNAPIEELSATSDVTSADLSGLVTFTVGKR